MITKKRLLNFTIFIQIGRQLSGRQVAHWWIEQVSNYHLHGNGFVFWSENTKTRKWISSGQFSFFTYLINFGLQTMYLGLSKASWSKLAKGFNFNQLCHRLLSSWSLVYYFPFPCHCNLLEHLKYSISANSFRPWIVVTENNVLCRWICK